MVAGLWGVIYYKEIAGPYSIGLFALSVVAIIGGAALLALFG